MYGLGKYRTDFGRWLDERNITQRTIAELSGLGGTTISKLCGDPTYRPKFETAAKIKEALTELGENVPDEYFKT